MRRDRRWCRLPPSSWRTWSALADYHLLHPIDIRHVATTTRAVLWVNSAVAQAFAQRAPCVIVGDIYPKSGAGTAELLYETAANAIVHTISGSHLEGCGAADGKYPNASGLEARFMAEVGRAVTAQGLDIAQANELVSALLEKYEYLFGAAQRRIRGYRSTRCMTCKRSDPRRPGKRPMRKLSRPCAGWG